MRTPAIAFAFELVAVPKQQGVFLASQTGGGVCTAGAGFSPPVLQQPACLHISSATLAVSREGCPTLWSFFVNMKADPHLVSSKARRVRHCRHAFHRDACRCQAGRLALQ